MGGTDRPGERRGHSGRSGHNGGNGRSSHGVATAVGPAGSVLSAEYYRSLLQFAALLTGDAGIAEAVVSDALTAMPPAAAGWSADHCLSNLQRLVLARSRRAGRYRRLSARRGQQSASDFARLPVVMALISLPQSAREAVVLTHYLDLPAAQAAAVAGVSEALLTANLATAMLALDEHLTELSPDS
jgi:DNA-directed RNA polymerase specialized sigma24 family protein